MTGRRPQPKRSLGQLQIVDYRLAQLVVDFEVGLVVIIDIQFDGVPAPAISYENAGVVIPRTILRELLVRLRNQVVRLREWLVPSFVLWAGK